jgi:phenylalanyl-tRNA synthetase beta chain
VHLVVVHLSTQTAPGRRRRSRRTLADLRQKLLLQTSETNPSELPHKLKIEVPANRYDLLCLEGLARALRIYLGIESLPNYRVLPWSGRTATVAKACSSIRPYFGAAILRGIKFDQQRYNSFIDLQDKLHMNLARKRTLVAIGTHDLSRIAWASLFSANHR